MAPRLHLGTPHRTLWRYLVSYIAVLIIPLGISLFAYSRAIGIVEAGITRTNITLLNQSRDIMDRYLDEVDFMVKRLSVNSKVLSFLSMDPPAEGSPEIYRMIDAWYELSSYRITNSFVRNLYIHSRSCDFIISPYGTYIREGIFYSPHFLEYTGMPRGEWRARILDSYHDREYMPARAVTVSDQTASVITFLQSLPPGSSNKPLGSVIVLIDNAAIEKLLGNLDLGEEGWVYVDDGGGRIITTLAGRKAAVHGVELDPGEREGSRRTVIDGRRMVVSHTTSGYNGWRYVTVLPERLAMSKALDVRRLIVIWSVAALLIGVAFAYSLAYRTTKRLSDITDTIRASLGGEADRTGDEITYLRQGINELISKRSELQATLREQQPVIRAAAVERVLTGRCRDQEEIRALMDHLGISLDAEGYAAAVVRIGGYEDAVTPEILRELDLQRIVVRDVFTAALGRETQGFDPDVNRVALLLTSRGEEPAAWKARVDGQIGAAGAECARRYNIHVLCGVGDLRRDLRDVGYSFLEARQAAESLAARRGVAAVWHSDIHRETDSFWYPLEVEQRLMNTVKVGDKPEVERLIALILAENSSRRGLSQEMTHQLLAEMQGTIARMVEHGAAGDGVRARAAEITRVDCLEDAWERVLAACLSLCDTLAQNRAGRDERLRGEITAFLDSSYMRHDLNLYTVAARFDLKETYLYYFFRDKIGQTFASYLESVRMRTACQLLTGTDLSVEEIADRVGYNSDHAFRRAFKRHQGVIPSDYKKKVAFSPETAP